jgi:hypothetical protein
MPMVRPTAEGDIPPPCLAGGEQQSRVGGVFVREFLQIIEQNRKKISGLEFDCDFIQ